MEFILKTGAKYSPGSYIRKKITNFIPIKNNENIIFNNPVTPMTDDSSDSTTIELTNDNIELIRACKKKFIDEALNLINDGELITNYSDYNGDTALTIACKNNLSDVAIELIKSKLFRTDAIDHQWKTPLMHACINGMQQVCFELLKTDSCAYCCYDKEGKTALEYATNNNIDDVFNAINIVSTLGYHYYMINFVDEKYYQNFGRINN